MIRFGPGLGLRAAPERQPGAQPKRVCWSESKLSASAVREVTESLWDQAGRRRGSTQSASAATGDASRAAARGSSGCGGPRPGDQLGRPGTCGSPNTSPRRSSRAGDYMYQCADTQGLAAVRRRRRAPGEHRHRALVHGRGASRRPVRRLAGDVVRLYRFPPQAGGLLRRQSRAGHPAVTAGGLPRTPPAVGDPGAGCGGPAGYAGQIAGLSRARPDGCRLRCSFN